MLKVSALYLEKQKSFVAKKNRVSEGIILKFVLSEEWDLILKHRASEIRVKRIRVNQGLGVHSFLKYV